MERQFDAFISYRHHPVDSKVAEAVQKQLEHFRIPKAVQKNLGIKHINHIFRDKEELPVTSDLNDNIGTALSNSKYLIVICSPRTKESIWVQREIELFLSTHGRDKVLTVLVEGEPGDVIPEILLKEEVTTVDEDGNTVKKMIPREPLSSDYRMGINKAKNIELLRLAATILGCSYDDLRQRVHQYRMRRAIAIFSVITAVLVGFSGYVLWSSTKIQENYNLAQENYERAELNYELAMTNMELAEENYREAQKNYELAEENLQIANKRQAVQLATVSMEKLEAGDRTLALQLASASAKLGENITPETELALSGAIYAYRNDISSIFPEVRNTIKCTDKTLVNCEVDRSISAINNALYIYDLSSGECVNTVYTDATITYMKAPEKSDFFVVKTSGLECREAVDGTLRWKLEGSYYYPGFNQDGTKVIAIKFDYSSGNRRLVDAIDAKTGEIVEEYDLTETGYSTNYFWIDDVAFVYVDYEDAKTAYLSFYYFATGETRRIKLPERVYSYYWELMPDGNLAMLTYCSDNEARTNLLLYNAYVISNGETGKYIASYEQCTATVWKFDVYGNLFWNYSFKFESNLGSPAIETLSIYDDNATESVDGNSLVAYISNKFAILNSDTGECLWLGEMPGAYIGGKINTSTGTGLYATSNGYLGVLSLQNAEKKYVGLAQFYKAFSKDMYRGAVLLRGGEYYAISQDNEIECYFSNLNDNNASVIIDERSAKYSSKYYYDQYMIAFISVSGGYSFDVYDLKNNSFMYSVPIDSEDASYFSITPIGVADNGYFVYSYRITGANDKYIGLFDIKTGNRREAIPISTAAEVSVSGDLIYYNDYLYSNAFQKHYAIDIESGSETLISENLPSKYKRSGSGNLLVSLNESDILLWHNDGNYETICTLDRTEADFSSLLVSFSDDDKYVLIGSDTMMYVWNCDDHKLITKHLSEEALKSAAFWDGSKYLFCATSDGTLVIYDVMSMDVVYSLPEEIYYSVSNDAKINIEKTNNGQLAVWVSTRLLFLDATDFHLCQRATGICSYNAVSDTIWTYQKNSNNDFSILSYPHYSVAELVSMAEIVTGNLEMDEETKRAYGLE